MKNILKMLFGGDFQSGVYAKGGSLEAHGIKQGDTFLKTISGNIQKVKDKNGKIVYVDQTGTHAQSEQMVQFILEEGIAPSPKPSATKKPVTPPTDGCKNQIKN